MTIEKLEKKVNKELNRIQYIKKLQSLLKTPVVSNKELNRLEKKLMRGMISGDKYILDII